MSLEKKLNVKKLVLVLATFMSFITTRKKTTKNPKITKINEDGENNKNDKYLGINFIKIPCI